MKTLYVALSSIIFAACATNKNNVTPNYYVDPALQEYVTEFDSMVEALEMSNKGWPIQQIRLVDYLEKENTWAVCNVVQRSDGVQYRTIYVDRNYTTTAWRTRTMVFHEMLHCRMNILFHSEDWLNIMFYAPNLWDDYWSEELYQQTIDWLLLIKEGKLDNATQPL